MNKYLWWVGSGYFLCSLVLALNVSATLGYEEIYCDINGFEERIEKKLNEFSDTGDVQVLEETVRELLPGYNKGDNLENWWSIRARILSLRLKALDACYNARDWSFDVMMDRKNLPETVILFELKDAATVEARDEILRRHEIAKKKRTYEVRLQKVYDRLLGRVNFYLEGISTAPDFNIAEDIAVIENLSIHAQLKKTILEALPDDTPEYKHDHSLKNTRLSSCTNIEVVHKTGSSAENLPSSRNVALNRDEVKYVERRALLGKKSILFIVLLIAGVGGLKYFFYRR